MQKVTSPCRHSGFRFEEFRGALTLPALADLEASFEPVSFETDTMIFKAQNKADRIVLVKSGCVAVLDQNARHLASKGDGHVFGLLEVLAGSPHRLGLKAVTAVHGWSLPADKLIKLLRDHPQLCLRVLSLVASVYNETIPHLT